MFGLRMLGSFTAGIIVGLAIPKLGSVKANRIEEKTAPISPSEEVAAPTSAAIPPTSSPQEKHAEAREWNFDDTDTWGKWWGQGVRDLALASGLRLRSGLTEISPRLKTQAEFEEWHCRHPPHGRSPPSGGLDGVGRYYDPCCRCHINHRNRNRLLAGNNSPYL
jgi:hypothetical protein